tara:strand:- start:3440 stop:4039 length:600 start_codon:yes stop_codon:yes gene_type:complete
MLDQFESGQLPEEISYLFRIAESKGNHPFRNMILSVEPVKSPSTGTLSAFVFATEDDGVEWLESHPQYNKHKIETTSPDVFIMEVEDLKTDRKIEIESLSLWIRNKDDEWCEFTKPLTDYLGEEMTEKEQLKSSMLDDVREEYEAYINSNDLDDDERALSVCILQMEDDVKESLLKDYDSELVTELLTEIKAGKFDRYV